MHEFSLEQLAAWSHAEVLNTQGPFGQWPVSGISCDSRTIKPGMLFVALHGERFDGHQFIGQALSRGAGAVLIDDQKAIQSIPQEKQIPVLLVEDTTKALQALASGYRQQLGGKVIAVTGSVGKTSTRQMIASCLYPAMHVHQAKGNLNNEIGLPQTLLSADPSSEAIVLEMGMRGPGEIELLSRIANPDLAVITCIGWSHIGRLGSREAILSAKWEILSGLRRDGLILLNADDPLLMQAAKQLPEENRLAFVCQTGQGLTKALSSDPLPKLILHAESIQVTEKQTTFCARAIQPEQSADESVFVTLPYPGAHHVRNALFGLAVARWLQVDLATAAAGAGVCGLVGNRQRIVQIHGVTIMDDSYNASPESMEAAFEALSLLAGGNRKIAALGCMQELGPFSSEAHRQVGELAAKHGFSLLLVYGPEGEDYLIGARSLTPDLPSCVCQDQNEMTERLAAAAKPGDFILIKGSRAFFMENVVLQLTKRLDEKSGRHLAAEGERHS